MSLATFQRALADSIASPEFCKRLTTAPDLVADQYQLSEAQLHRLLHCVRHRGMRVCWGLHRANRLGPIHAVLPLTCVALGAHLGDELESFWLELPKDLQFRPEGERFAVYLLQRIKERTLNVPFVEDVVRFELGVSELRFQSGGKTTSAEGPSAIGGGADLVLHPLIRILQFHADPDRLLNALTQDRLPPGDLPPGLFYVMVDAREDGLAVHVLQEEVGRLLNTFAMGVPAVVDEELQATLLRASLIVRDPSPARG